MAKQKKEKQIPAKQQMYEQILTKQLYGAPPTREEGIAKLQADYDAWNERQQGIAKLQTEYDNWLNEQKKAQQPVKAPKVETVKAPVQQTPALKKNKVETIAPKSEEKKYLTHADVIPSLNKKSVEKQTQMNKVAQNNAASVAKIAKQLGVSEDEVKQRMTAPKQELNAYNEKKIDKNTTESMQKAASEKKRKAAQKKYNPWEAFTGRFAKATTDVVNAPLAIVGKLTGKDLSIYNDAQKQEFKDIQEQHPVASTAGDLAGMAFAAYALGGGSKGTAVPKGNVTSGQVFKALRDDAILNGATKGGATAQALKGALPTLAGNAASNMPTDFAVDIIPTLANDIAEGEKSNKQIVRDTLLNTGINAGFNAIGDIASLGKAMKNSGNPITADDAFRANALEGYEKLKNYELSDDAAKQIPKQEVPKAQIIDTINVPPKNINAGKATHIDTIYAGDIPQNLGGTDRIDIANDSYANAVNALEEANNSENFATVLRKRFNSLFDSKGGQRKVIIDNTSFGGGDYVVDINKSSVNKTINNGRLSPEKLAVLDDIDSVVAKGEYVGSGAYNNHHAKNKNVVRYDYFETPVSINGQNYIVTYDVEVYKNTNNYRTHKVVNEINLTPVNDEVQGLISNSETAGAHLRIPDGIAATSAPKADAPTQFNTAAVDSNMSPSTYDIADGIQNVNKNSVNFELPEETFDKIDSHFEELARPLNEVQNSGIMNNVTDEKALTEWANVNEAYSDYLDKAMFGESIEEAEAAKKALDNARKRYARAMKEIDPDISKAFNSGSFGYKIGRPLNERNVDVISKQGQEAVDAINELENFGNIKPEKSTYIDATGKRPYAKNQGVSPAIENEAKRIDKWIEDQGLEEELAEEAQEALNKASKTAGADPLQFFANGDTEGEWKTGKWRLNTAEKTGKIKNSADLPEKNFAYREFKEAEQNEAALERYKDSKDIANDLMNLDKFDEVDVKAAMNEWQRLMDAGDAISLRKAKWLGIKIDGEVREGGRVIQALAEYSRNTPEGQLRTAQEAIDKIVDKKVGNGTSEALDNLVSKINKAYIDSNGDTEAFSKRVEELLSENLRKYASSKTAKNMSSKTIVGKNTILKMISDGASIEEIADKVYKQNGGVKLTIEEQKRIFDYLTEASELTEGSYEQEELLARAAKIAVGRAPSTLGQKIRSVLYNNMLGNFKTALSRNAFGNMAYQTLEQARQPISAIVDRGTSLFTKKRSALGWNTGKAGAYIQGLKKGTVEQLTDMSKHIDTGRSGAKGWEVALANNATTYNDSNVIGKFANGVEYYVRNAMELGDRPFFEANYKQNYIELEQLVERYGKDNVAGLEGIDEKDLPEVMDMISSVRAADSVFQKHGKMSKGLTDLRNGLGEMSEGIVGVDVLSTAASPFTMTPGNMIERAIEYTPLGFAKNAVETIKEVAGKKGFNQRRFVDEASRSIAGLPILYGTYKMAKNGQINGGYSTDTDERAAQQEDGFIEYGYNVPESVPYYGGKTLDTSDLPVIGPMMQAGAVMSEEGVSPTSSLQAAEAILGGSTTQGIRRAFGADSGSYSSQDSVIDNLKNTVLSSGSQLVPSLVRQTAQTTDEYKRDLGEYGTNEYYLNLIKNSLPKLRETLPIKTNVEGKPVLQNQGRPLPAKILENYVLPMNVSEYTPSELNKEASRLLEKTGEATGFAPKALRKDLRAWDESDEKEYSEEQFRNYKKNLGELNSTAGTTLTNSDFYKNLSDESKVKYLSETYAAMKQVARKNATGSIGDNKAAQAYIDAGGGEKGIKKMIEYFQARDIAKTNNVSTNSKAYEAIETAVSNGAIGRAKEIASAEKEKKDVFEKYGLENTSTSRKLYDDYDESALKDYADFQKEGLKASAVYVYQSAKKEGGTIPSIKDFAKTYKKMDSYGDNNGNVSQKEFSAYLDSGNYSLEEATSLAQTYGDWKSIPYLKKDGHWGFHKAK